MAERFPVRFKIARTAGEFEQIHALNYRTFVEEIPQHEPNRKRRLVDRFHAQNTYLIALRGDRLVGMMAVRGERPFSLDVKLADLDSYLPPGRSVCEVRLAAVVAGERRGRVLWGLLQLVREYLEGRGWDLAIASCTPLQMKLYRHLGFVPFGPLVGTPEVPFQPMYITVEAFDAQTRELEQRTRSKVQAGKSRRIRTVPATG
jgi:N-acyl amino acid synthase FeeM